MADSTYSDRELCAAIEAELSGSPGLDTSELSHQRADAMKRYLGEPYGNEKDDRSNVTTREVMDTIEWIKPELMKLFASGGDTVRFEPETEADIEQAQQETDYVNYLFHRKNAGFRVLYEWITDGLLQKTGVVKVWNDDTPELTREEYQGLTEGEALSLLRGPDIEDVLERHEYDDPNFIEQRDTMLRQLQEQATGLVEQLQSLPPEQQQQAMQQLQQFRQQAAEITQTPVPKLYDLVVKIRGESKGITLEVVPPEEFAIAEGAKDISSARFCAHTREISISDLREMGYPDDILERLPANVASGVYLDDEKQARHQFDGTDENLHREKLDGPGRLVEMTEAYIRYDYDEDGITELRKVMKVGSTILDNTEVDCMPFAGWTPIIISHKWSGLSIADLVSDIQRIKTQLFRNMLDNQYLANNGRYVVVDGMVDTDDLMSSRPHGIVRAKMQGAVQRLDTPQLGQTAFAMLEYVDRMREERTGVSERTQGVDPNQLNSNTAATAVNQVMTAAQQRIELIARVFAETGLTDLFRLMHKLVVQTASKQEIFRLRDRYVEVDPRTWKHRKDTSVVVGLGNGSREQEMLQLNMIFQNQMTLAQNPAMAPLVSPTDIYNTLEDQVKVFDKASAGRYFTDPESDEAKQRMQQQQKQQEQMQQQQQQMQQMQLEMQKMTLQIEQFKAQSSAEAKQKELEIKRRKQALDEKAEQNDVLNDTAELELDEERVQQGWAKLEDDGGS